MTPQEEAVAQLIRRIMTDLRSIRNMLEVLVWTGLAVVGLLTALVLVLLPGNW